MNWIFISSAAAGVQMIGNEISSNDDNLIMGTPQKETSVSAGPPDAKFTRFSLSQPSSGRHKNGPP
ncbi:hypothetical protein [Bradyrhizobium sp. USDA 3650]